MEETVELTREELDKYFERVKEWNIRLFEFTINYGYNQRLFTKEIFNYVVLSEIYSKLENNIHKLHKSLNVARHWRRVLRNISKKLFYEVETIEPSYGNLKHYGNLMSDVKVQPIDLVTAFFPYKIVFHSFEPFTSLDFANFEALEISRQEKIHEREKGIDNVVDDICTILHDPFEILCLEADMCYTLGYYTNEIYEDLK